MKRKSCENFLFWLIAWNVGCEKESMQVNLLIEDMYELYLYLKTSHTPMLCEGKSP